MRRLNPMATSLFAIAATVSMQASAASKVCVFDMLGAQGDVTGMMKDYILAAKGMGTQLELKTYTDERTAAEDFKAGQCDAVMLTGLRGRQFNDFTGSLDSLGSIPSNKIMEKVLAKLTNPALAAKMIQGKYEVAGIAPAGAAYIFVKDRSISSVEKLAGKKIAVFDYNKSQAKIVQKIGAQPVLADITNFATKFNNGAVDIVVAPALAYKPLEMYKGLGKNGAIVRFPVVQLTFQLIINKEKFPADFGLKSRAYWGSIVPRAMSLVAKAERDIPAGVWMDLSEKNKDGYVVLLRDARIALTKEGIYNPLTMNVLKKTRCSVNTSDAECSQNLE